MLGTPPAFILSQDQTLMFKFVRSKSVWLILPFYCCFRFLFSEISLRTFVLFGIFRVALLFICQGAVLLIGSVSRRTFVPVVQTAYWVYHKQFCLSRTFSFYFQVSFETWLLITRSNSSLFYQNFLFMSSSFLFFWISFQKSVLLSIAATAINFTKTIRRCQALFLLF